MHIRNFAHEYIYTSNDNSYCLFSEYTSYLCAVCLCNVWFVVCVKESEHIRTERVN